MKTYQTTKTNEMAQLPAAQSNTRATSLSAAGRINLHGCVAIALLAMAGSAFAQTTNVANVYNVTGTTIAATVNSVALTSLSANKARLTVAVNETNSAATSVRVNLGGGQTALTSSTTNFIDPDYYITNFYDLNAAVATLTATGVPGTGGGAAVAFGAASITNATAGNANSDVAVTLNHTNLTSGDYDMAVVATGANSWSYPLPVKAGFKWSAAGGANTNFNNTANWIGGVVPGASDIVILDVAGAVSSSSQPTIAITSDTTIGSVSDIHTGDNYTHWNIAAGATLSILGDGGFRQLIDVIDGNDRSRIRGSGAGTLVISNANAMFNMTTTRKNNSTDNADFSALNTMVVDVKQITFNDIASYPNAVTNGTVNYPRQNIYDMDWALTNILRATHTDANGWTNDSREYGFSINRQTRQTGNDGGMHFGLWNELYADSILFGGNAQMENPEVDFRAGSGSYLKIRNTDKVSRVSNLTIADAMSYLEPEVNNSGASKIDVSFTKGTVDALIDTLIIGRAPKLTANGPANGKLFLGAGTFDANTAYLGYEVGAQGGTESGAGNGRVDVNSGTLFRVNNTLVLGYTDTNLSTVVTGGGELNVNSGGTAEINNITVGGPANASINNFISINGGGDLIVSNTVGSASARVNQLTMNDSTISLFANPANTNVFVKTLVTGGAGNTIKLVALTGVSSYPVTVSLFSYVDPAAPNFGLDLPSGLYGYVVNNTTGSTIDAVISTNPPQSLVWDGGTGVWDLLAANWQGAKIFGNGDGVTFDDTATGTTTVTVSGSVTLGSAGILVTNDTKAYTLTGGNIGGSATLVKDGTNTLTVDAVSALAMIINSGTVNGSGTLGTTTVGSGAALNYSGTINKLTTSGATANSGTVNISVDVQGGIFNNTGTINGGFSTSGSSVITNSGGSVVENSGNASVGAGSALVQEGEFRNNVGRLTVAGTLTGSGSVWDFTGDANGNNGRLEINPSGVFTPGGAGVIGSFYVNGRFDLNEGSPNGILAIDFDLGHPQTNDILYVDKFSNFRGAFHFNNIGAAPFAAGQSFLIYSNNFGFPNTPEASNNYLNKTVPAVPGVGLQWDFTNLKLNGLVAVVAAPLTPPALTATNVGGTNQTLSWPGTHLGYQLQVQTNTLATGISTNWSPIVGTESVVSTNFPIDPANPSVFYRLSNQ